MHTILGSGGIIATELAKSLIPYNTQIRLVSRQPRKVNETDDTFIADLTQQDQVISAVKNSKIVYLTVGLAYNTRVWERDWPIVMNNVINACKQENAKLVFFDNVYMYGKVDGWMHENTPMNPCSRKGEVRAKISQQLLDEINHGNITAMICRSADFYGPNASNTFVLPMVFERLKHGKPASCLVNDQLKHSMTFTPDSGKAVALLANTESAYNQIWHLPTDRNALTGKQFIEEVARCFSAAPKYSVLSKWMMKAAGLFNPMARESVEMLYQNEFEYLFDSSKFENTFFSPSTYREGIEITAKSLD
ncbi:MAG TPA: NAD-dependent epimerase/dehydratase family protein [Gammaproteobacteria bacterium]